MTSQRFQDRRRRKSITSPTKSSNSKSPSTGKERKRRNSYVLDVSSSPTAFPGLFDIRSEEQSDESSSGDGGITVPAKSARERRANDVDMYEEAREYLRVCDHSLHSVLSNPRSNWGEVLYSTFYAEEPDIAVQPFPGFPTPSDAEIDKLKRSSDSVEKFVSNHARPLEEQLSSFSIPSMKLADQHVSKCLQTVPKMYFRGDFDLSNPETFEKVLLQPDAQNVQEELSGYLDLVEETLLRQVSSRSTSFFEACSNQEDLFSDVSQACVQVRELRAKLNHLKKNLALKSLEITQLKRRKDRMNGLESVVSKIREIHQAESSVQALLHTHDFLGALDLIDETKRVLDHELSAVKCLQSVKKKIGEYYKFITTQLCDHFISTAISTESTITCDDKPINTTNSSRYDLHLEVPLLSEAETELENLTTALIRVRHMSPLLLEYKSRLKSEMKVTVKTVVSETIAASKPIVELLHENGNQNGSAPSKKEERNVADQLKSLSLDEFLGCLMMIFEHLVILLQRAVFVHRLIEDRVDRLAQFSPCKSPSSGSKHSSPKQRRKKYREKQRALKKSANRSLADRTVRNEQDGDGGTAAAATATQEKEKEEDENLDNVIEESDEVIRICCEFAQRSVSNLFSVRKEVQSVYSMDQLRRLYDQTMEFVLKLEQITGKTDYTLRGALFAQLKLFLEKYHQKQLEKLIESLNKERRKITEVSGHRQLTLSRIVDAFPLGQEPHTTTAPNTANESSLKGRDFFVQLGLNAMSPSSSSTTASLSDTRTRFIEIPAKRFHVVWSVLFTVELLLNYVIISANFPVLSSLAFQKSMEILRTFNSRTTQLVLGAGAMQMAKLKSISARHLALVAQSLGFLLGFIPYFNAVFLQYLPEKQVGLTKELTRIQQDIHEHQQKIFTKFVSIVEEQIMKKAFERSSQRLTYDRFGKDGGEARNIPTEPIRSIVDNTTKLHAVLRPILPLTQLNSIFTRIFEMLKRKLPVYYDEINPTTAKGRECLVKDIEHLLHRLRDLEDLDVQQQLVDDIHSTFELRYFGKKTKKDNALKAK